MVASDVAARGLDIPKVEHVIHYQTPKNSEVRREGVGINCFLYQFVLLLYRFMFIVVVVLPVVKPRVPALC